VRSGPLPDFPFRWSGHDRLAARRKDSAFLAEAWADPKSRVVTMRDGKLVADDSGLVFSSPLDAPADEPMLLGAIDGVVHFLVLLPDPDADAGPSDPLPWSDLRTLAGVLDQRALSLAVHAIALGRWHRVHPHCSVCGHPTEVTESGASRRCPACRALHFPRTDPAVIMLVVDDDDRALLGHNSARAAGWYSTLAGFVEPGESPEEAVAREVWEEAGVEVTEVTYAGSQPWPFPSSLMLGFFARATSVDIEVDGDEITEARWFSRQAISDEIRSGTLVVPTTISIAGALLSSWYGGPLPEPPG
jgi:NAD+ diphosphatase